MELLLDQDTRRGKETAEKDLMPSMFEDNSVGPGAYSLPWIVPEGPKYSFPQAERFQTPTNETRYAYMSLTPEKLRQSKQVVLNKSSSVPPHSTYKLYQASDSPGPGSYNLSSTLYDNYFTLKGKYKPLKNQEHPGPGTYEVEVVSPIKFPLTTQARFKDPVSNTSNVNLTSHDYKKTGISYSFGARYQTTRFDEIPGPGSYDIQPISSSPQITFKKRNKTPEALNTPGPGAYELSAQKSSPAFSMGLPFYKNDHVNSSIVRFI
jgi:Sperm-tail PG-rich repeat